MIDGGTPVGWPALVMLDDGSVAVSWLESLGGGDGEVRLRRVWPDGRLGRIVVMSSATSGRSTGIPQMALAGNQLVVAWRNAKIVSAMLPVPTD